MSETGLQAARRISHVETGLSVVHFAESAVEDPVPNHARDAYITRNMSGLLEEVEVSGWLHILSGNEDIKATLVVRLDAMSLMTKVQEATHACNAKLRGRQTGCAKTSLRPYGGWSGLPIMPQS